ncbi:hypothetical protein RB595_007137 [Gaeumannomyces hyphopodioides]
MFRANVLRSAVASVARVAAARPAVSSPVARLAVRSAAAPATWMPKTAAAPWTAVRCYAAAAGLDKAAVEERIVALLKNFDKVNDPETIKPTSHFANDLGLDSLDTVEVVMAIEEEFSIEIPDKDADTIHSVDKAVEYILSQPDAH